MNSQLALKTDKLTKTYITGKIEVIALKDVDLSVKKGDFIGITGESGSGKSTLMNLLGGLDTPTSGTIEAEGKIISQMNKEELALYRRYSVGMIFQSFNLIPSFTAQENVSLPLLFAGVPKAERKAKASEALKNVGLSHRQRHRPSELSGGEQQRVAIARALVNQPKVLLADEPTGNLDSKISHDIAELLGNLNQSRGLTVVMVSHEEPLLKEFAQGIIRLRDGMITARETI